MSTSNISEIHLYNALKLKLGEKEAEELVQFVKTNVQENIENEISNIATKKDLAETKVDIIKWVVGIFFALALMIIGLYLKN
jgi:hypothetical protein